MAAAEPMVLASWIATLVRALDADGIDGRALAGEVGIDVDALDRAQESRVPLTRTKELWRLAVEATGDPCFGIEVSRHVRPGSFQALGVGVVSSRTLFEAFDRIIRFGDVVLTAERRNLLRRRGERYELVLGGVCGDVQPALESMEAILASIVRMTRFLVRRDVSPVAVHLVRPEPPASSRFERFFGCDVAYGCGEHLLAFDRDLVERPLPAACEALAKAADRLASDYVERVRTSAPFVDEVRAAVSALVAHGEPTAAAVAGVFAMSDRTLQRRLHEEGATFRDLVCEARIDLAKQLLATERPGVHALAHRLGFSEPAAFRRAFKRRTGMTPADFVADLDGAGR